MITHLLGTVASYGLPSTGAITTSQQRVYAIIGAAPGTIGVGQQRAYAIIGAAPDTIGVGQQRFYAIIQP